MCQADPPHPEKDRLVDARASGCCSRGQPCMRRNNQGLHTCFQSWVDHRCKARIVVGRQRIERAILLRLVIYLRIVTAKEPEHRRSVPLRSKASEILARAPSPKKHTMRQDVFSLAEGTVTIQWPTPLSADSIQDLKDWLKIVERKIARSVETSTAQGQTDDGQ